MVAPALNPVANAKLAVIENKVSKRKPKLNKIQHLQPIILHANPQIPINNRNLHFPIEQPLCPSLLITIPASGQFP